MATESVQSQNDILNTARKERKRVQIYLVNGIRVVGQVESFDQYVVMLRAAGTMQVIYKKAISTVQHDVGDARSSSPRPSAAPRPAPRTALRDTSRDASREPVVVTRKRRLITGGKAD